jgi:hypothetical protein
VSHVDILILSTVIPDVVFRSRHEMWKMRLERELYELGHTISKEQRTWYEQRLTALYSWVEE